MYILLAGHIAMPATNKLIITEKPALSCRFSNRFLSLCGIMSSKALVSKDQIVNAIADLSKEYKDIDLMELGDKGIFGSLWEYAEVHNCGLEIMLECISVKQETIEIFEELNINPYTYPSNGAWLIRSDRAYELMDILVRAGITASVIGRETSTKDRVIINQDEKRFLTPIDRLIKDEQGIKNLR